MNKDAPVKAASNSYQTPDSAKQLLRLTDPLVIAGVTAAGKNAVSKKLVSRGKYQRVVTNTTRKSRVKEAHGEDYWFCSDEQMFNLIKEKRMVETEVIHDSVYGCTIEGLLHVAHTGLRPILTIDVNGAMNLRRLAPGIRPLFLIPPSFDEWMTRLGSRSFLSDGERNRRMHSARDELEIALRSRDFTIIVNNDLDDTLATILAGVATDDASQEKPRKAAEELLGYIKNR